MAGVFNAIALGIMGVSLLPLGEELFPPPHKASTVIRVGAGLSMPGHSDANTGGAAPGFALFDGNGNRIGFKSGARNGMIKDGHFKDITIDPIDNDNNRPPEYLSIVAGGSDALCVAYMYVTPPSSEFWAFYGDTARACDAPWYYSNLAVQKGSDPYKPACFWIVSPHPDGSVTGDGTLPEAIGIHTIDFAGTEARRDEYLANNDLMCKSAPRFKTYDSFSELNCLPIFNPPLKYNGDGTDEDPKKLNTDGQVMCDPGPGKKPTLKDRIHLQKWSSRPNPRPTYGTKRSHKPRRNDQICYHDHNPVLIKSDYDFHTASELCTSDTSVGPDFISTKEGLFCDMCTRQLFPLCSPTITQNCFDMATNITRNENGHQRRDGDGDTAAYKEYKDVWHWG